MALSRSIAVRSLRPLTEFELEVLNKALVDLSLSSASKRLKDGAMAMLDQDVPHIFFWGNA